MGLVVVAFVFTFAFALAAGAQETTDQSADDASTDSGQPLEFADGDQAAQAQAASEQPGPLAGTEVEALDADQDQRVEVVTIPRTDCTFEEGASFVLQDGDGTQADFIDGVNIVMSEVDGGLEAVSQDADQGANIVPLNERGGSDDDLGTTGLVIVTSTDISCEASGPSDGTSPPVENSPSPDDTSSPDANSPPDNTSSPDATSPPDGSATPEPEPQDEEKGPLEGGTAIGKDILVPGDIIDILPDGRRVAGIDQIIIKTENCEFTGQGSELTITMSDRGVPFRIRDGDNADITLQEDGTIVANGRETLGETFPERVRDNPNKRIIPIPVDPENDEFKRGPNDTFPIVSSTGVGGEGCRALNGGTGADDTNRTTSMDDDGANAVDTDAGDTDSRADVVPDTKSKKPLPDTGGVPLLALAIAALFAASGGVLLLRTMTRRNA
jgi:hypothetical protein